MDLVEKLFDEIGGSDKVLKLLAGELSDIGIPEGPKVNWVFIKGTEDLELNARLPSKDEQYKNHPTVAYQWPHLIVYAEKGSIEGVRTGGNGSTLIASDKSRALVRINSFASECVNYEGASGAPRFYEAVLEIRYVP